MILEVISVLFKLISILVWKIRQTTFPTVTITRPIATQTPPFVLLLDYRKYLSLHLYDSLFDFLYINIFT